MKKLCIDKITAERMKKAVADGEISVADLYQASTAERREIFEKFSSKELAGEINLAFEKIMVSKQKDALKKWAENVFTPKEKTSEKFKNVLDKIDELDKLGVLTDKNEDTFLFDLVADKLGISVSPQEVEEITARANQLKEAFEAPTSDGLPPVDYWVKRREMEDYLNGLTPNSNLKVATSIAGRGAMLLSVKSPLTNIISNTVQGLFEAFTRRISSNTYAGLNGDFALDYVKKVNDVFQKSGYDISRMEAASMGQKRLGEDITHSQGTGPVRALGRWYEDIVFKQLMGAPDVAASSIAFADSANLATTKMAHAAGLEGESAKAKALEIFKDSILIEPKTVEGQIARSQGLADALYSTYTNKGGYSDFAMAIRTAINNATGDLRLGDQLMPFVKTPANVIQAGVEASGAGIFRGFWKLPEAMRAAKAGDPGPMRDAVKSFITGGLGMTLAAVLAFSINPDDFVGEYDNISPKEKDMARLKNAPYNSMKVGNKYVSMDYFGPLAPAIIGILYARKYGETLPDKIFQYGRGVASQAARLPGLREFSDLVQNINKAVTKGSLSDSAGALTDEGIAYVRARVIPAIVNDTAKGIDPNERTTGRDQVSKTISSIPGLRETLPARIDFTTGKPVKSEGFLSTILFGNRLKTANENELVKEITRLYESGAGPTVSDIEYASKRVKELKEQISEKDFQKAIVFYGETYGENALDSIQSDEYENADDEEKKKILDRARTESLDAMLNEFGYQKKEK